MLCSSSSLPRDVMAKVTVGTIPAVSSQGILADVQVKAPVALPTATAVVIPTGLKIYLSVVVVLNLRLS